MLAREALFQQLDLRHTELHGVNYQAYASRLIGVEGGDESHDI